MEDVVRVLVMLEVDEVGVVVGSDDVALKLQVVGVLLVVTVLLVA